MNPVPVATPEGAGALAGMVVGATTGTEVASWTGAEVIGAEGAKVVPKTGVSETETEIVGMTV